MSKCCIDCDELPNEARAVRDLYTTKEYYKNQWFKLSEKYEELEAELKQLRKKEETP